MTQVRNLVIDLGGVLYAIDPPSAIAHFMALLPSQAGHDPLHWIQTHQPMFDALEAGTIDPKRFRDYLRLQAGLEATDAEIDHAWNKLLLGPIPGRANDLALLAKKYRLILLSNTNIIHQEFLNPECTELFAPFERLFFSFRMGIRKPDPEIYRRALAEMNMEASVSLFVDDNLPNIDGARLAGMLGLHVRAHSDLDWNNLMTELMA